jgi:hypothetical protein
MALTINGRSLASLGVTARALEGWLDGPVVQRESTVIPNLLGVSPSPVMTGAARQIRLTVNVPVAGLTSRAAAIATLQDALTGLLTLRFDDTPGRIVRAVAGPLTVASISDRASMNALGANMIASVVFLATDNASYDAEPLPVVLGSTPAEIELGTLPSPGIIQWSGSWSTSASRTLTYRGVNGIAYGSMVFTAPATPEYSPSSLSSSEFLEIDLGRQYITHVTNTGARTRAYDWLASGSWFVPEPADARRSAGRWPTLDVSAGVGLFLYRKAWAL